MFKLLLAAALSLAMPQPSVRPPDIIYQGDTLVAVVFATDVEHPDLCGKKLFSRIYACAFTEKRYIVMPNPCHFPGDFYAELMCHEMGHINGWKHDATPSITFNR